MEGLLDLAEALLEEYGDEPPRPNFPMPASYKENTPFELMELQPVGDKGKGWFAKQRIEAGTVLMIAKPVSMVMDWQDPENAIEEEEDEEEEEEDGEVYVLSKLSERLLLQILKELQHKPELWTNVLSELFPREDDDLSTLPKWVCNDDTLFHPIEVELEKLQFRMDDVEAVTSRLPLIIRYNVLSAETSPELLVHPSPQKGYSALTGTALYHWPSFFNHDATPNVSRYAVGDVMWFVANQTIAEGQEACISYLEHDVLCESPDRRSLLLGMDFIEPMEIMEDDGQGIERKEGGEQEEDDEGPDFPVVDIYVQNELMQMDPSERLGSIQELMEQAMGERRPEDEVIPEDEEVMDTGSAPWFQCDIQNLRILQALTLDALGQHHQAMPVWELCCKFASEKLPPHDESLVVMCVQAALCAQCCRLEEQAREFARKALESHNVLFGGGLRLFRRRYEREMQLDLRPDSSGADPDTLWPDP